MTRAFSLRLLVIGIAATVAGCGGGDGSPGSEHAPGADQVSLVKPSGDKKQNADARGAKLKEQAGIGASVADGKSASGNRTGSPSPGKEPSGGGEVSGTGQSAHQGASGKSKPPRGGGSPGKGPAGQGKGGSGGPSAGPGADDATPYGRARRICSDAGIVNLLPEEDRQDPEKLASMVSTLVPEADAGPTYEGCLDGLRSLGL